MRNNQVIDAFLNHNEVVSDNKNLRSTGTKLFSYSTCIAQWLDDILIINVTKYSKTTSTIQNRLAERALNRKINTIKVDGVGYNVSNLKSTSEYIIAEVSQQTKNKVINLLSKKMRIKVLEITEGCMPKIIKNGEWIDLMVATDTKVPRRKITYVPLGIAMKLPKGYEAVIIPRSSTAKKKRVLQANSVGLIDNSYCGNNDQWMFPAYAIGDNVELHHGDRICQFRIQLSQKASVWQKLKWLLCDNISLEKVQSLSEVSRGGFGSTGM